MLSLSAGQVSYKLDDPLTGLTFGPSCSPHAPATWLITDHETERAQVAFSRELLRCESRDRGKKIKGTGSPRGMTFRDPPPRCVCFRTACAQFCSCSFPPCLSSLASPLLANLSWPHSLASPLLSTPRGAARRAVLAGVRGPPGGARAARLPPHRARRHDRPRQRAPPGPAANQRRRRRSRGTVTGDTGGAE